MYNPYTLKDKIILVTGASSGIGATTAIQCSKMGAKLIILGRNKERLDNIYYQLEGSGHRQYIADLTQEIEITQLVESLPMLDGIVHSVGIGFTKPIKFINKKDIDKVFLSNFHAPVLISQKIMTCKKLKKASSVVFISSMAVITNEPGISLYAASKGALNAFARTFAREVVHQRIRVNSIQPGMVKTPLINSDIISEEQLSLDKKKYLLGRYGNPDDIAYLVIYLLSEASQWMTGNTITIDGGFSLQ